MSIGRVCVRFNRISRRAPGAQRTSTLVGIDFTSNKANDGSRVQPGRAYPEFSPCHSHPALGRAVGHVIALADRSDIRHDSAAQPLEINGSEDTRLRGNCVGIAYRGW